MDKYSKLDHEDKQKIIGKACALYGIDACGHVPYSDSARVWGYIDGYCQAVQDMLDRGYVLPIAESNAPDNSKLREANSAINDAIDVLEVLIKAYEGNQLRC